MKKAISVHGDIFDIIVYAQREHDTFSVIAEYIKDKRTTLKTISIKEESNSNEESFNRAINKDYPTINNQNHLKIQISYANLLFNEIIEAIYDFGYVDF